MTLFYDHNFPPAVPASSKNTSICLFVPCGYRLDIGNSPELESGQQKPLPQTRRFKKNLSGHAAEKRRTLMKPALPKMQSKISSSNGFDFKPLAVIALIMAIAGCAPELMITEPTPQIFGTPVLVGNLANQQISEASGLASSGLYPGALWVINDGGNDPLLYSIGIDGADLGTFRVEGASNYDWEALASFRLQDTAYLLIADVGDNWEQRETCTLYVVKEPTITATGLDDRPVVGIAWQIRFTYEDGPNDCEAVAVDTAAQRVLLLTKRSLPPVLYELPLQPADPDITALARRLTTIPLFDWPTAIDIAPDGLSAVVLTYNNAFLFARSQKEDWSAAFNKKPRPLNFNRLNQQEAICFGFYEKSVYVTSEQLPTPLVRIDLEAETN
jgi:hypothetical protein